MLRWVRIIAGFARGRRLVTPRGWNTRPTPDRVRESLFSMLAFRLEGSYVLDLFAGTGALGLECLSRGARHVVFVEKEKQALSHLRRNIGTVAAGSGNDVAVGSTELLTMPAARALRQLAQGPQGGAAHRPFDLIFLDPPYQSPLLQPTLQQILHLNLLAPSGMVVCEHHKQAAPPPLPEHESHQVVFSETRLFGDVALSFYEKGC